MTESPTPAIQTRHIDRFVPYARDPRRNDATVDRMCASIREFGFKVPVLARSDGTWWTATSGSKPRASWVHARRRHNRHPGNPLRRGPTHR